MIPAVAITALIFSIWHYGVVDGSFYNHAQIFMASVFLGVIYRMTGSLGVPMLIHFLYDGIQAFGPYNHGVQHSELISIISMLAAISILAFVYHSAAHRAS